MKDLISLKDSYLLYKQKCKERSIKPITKEKYLLITQEFMKFISIKLFNKGSVQLPLKTGILEVVGHKQKVVFEDNKIKGLAPNWVETKKLWEEDEEAKKNKQLVYHLNENTSGVRYKVRWNKRNLYMNHKFYYDLILSRANKRFLSHLIQNGKEYKNMNYGKHY